MSLLAGLAPHLPYLRRYARALCGDQTRGDLQVRLTLQELATGTPNSKRSMRVGLYRAFHNSWRSSGAAIDTGSNDTGSEDQAPQRRILKITPSSRQAFLLTAMEGFSPSETAQILDVTFSDVQRLVRTAQSEIEAELATDVLIIEDEPVIAADIAALVSELGHSVIDIATTHDEALRITHHKRPGLVLADIQLADGSSGVDAVRDILASLDVPVIFITAFPERLLTGERPEPTFLITKPFHPETVKAAIGQALFFHPQSARRAA